MPRGQYIINQIVSLPAKTKYFPFLEKNTQNWKQKDGGLAGRGGCGSAVAGSGMPEKREGRGGEGRQDWLKIRGVQKYKKLSSNSAGMPYPCTRIRRARMRRFSEMACLFTGGGQVYSARIFQKETGLFNI